jgi:hypothetical protein
MNKIPFSNIPSPLSGIQTGALLLGFKDGETALIQSIQSPGAYLVIFEDGSQVQVKGPVNLEIGTPVRVFGHSKGPLSSEIGKTVANTLLVESEATLALSVLIPLGFGGKGARAELEVYIPKEKVNINKKKVIYFIIALTTERLGDLQWSIHLWDRNVEAQLYVGQQVSDNEIRELTLEVEESFKKAGFYLTSSIVRLEVPFRVPRGFRLEWKA